jgi:hypothetical protein
MGMIMNNIFGKDIRGSICDQIMVLPWNLPEGIGEDHKKPWISWFLLALICSGG